MRGKRPPEEPGSSPFCFGSFLRAPVITDVSLHRSPLYFIYSSVHNTVHSIRLATGGRCTCTITYNVHDNHRIAYASRSPSCDTKPCRGRSLPLPCRLPPVPPSSSPLAARSSPLLPLAAACTNYRGLNRRMSRARPCGRRLRFEPGWLLPPPSCLFCTARSRRCLSCLCESRRAAALAASRSSNRLRTCRRLGCLHTSPAPPPWLHSAPVFNTHGVPPPWLPPHAACAAALAASRAGLHITRCLRRRLGCSPRRSSARHGPLPPPPWLPSA